MCGIVAVFGSNNVVHDIYESLTVLQHRGQDASGILTNHNGKILLRKSLGLVRDGFDRKHIDRLRGHLGIGHVRYPTAGHAESSAEAQPFYVNSPYGIGLAHNGNLINSSELKLNLFNEDKRHINTRSDSEILLNIFAHELDLHSKDEFSPDDVFYAVAGVHRRVRGAYAVVSLISERGIVAFRDPNGIRPLCYGTRTTGGKPEVMIASESVALDSCGYELVSDILPGEAIFIDMDGNIHKRICAETTNYTPCIFEYVYFARPDTIIDGISVYSARMKMGESLADKILQEWNDHDIDVVIPIPDTSRISALELSMKLGVPYREGFIKNRYIGRTFIMPGNEERKRSVRYKLVPQEFEISGKDVLIVDDSIVRGNTSRQIVKMIKEFGAKNVYFVSACPPVKFPCYYGVDMPTRTELTAANKTNEEIREFMGVDILMYQEVEDLKEAVTRKGEHNIDRPCMACLDGWYVTGDINEQVMESMENQRITERSVLK